VEKKNPLGGRIRNNEKVVEMGFSGGIGEIEEAKTEIESKNLLDLNK
jgi:hypothetical protein